MADQDNGNWLTTLRSQASDSDRSWSRAMTLSVLLGIFGADRFYLGFGVLGLLKLCTIGGAGWWWLFDVVWLLIGRMKDADGRFVRSPVTRKAIAG